MNKLIISLLMLTITVSCIRNSDKSNTIKIEKVSIPIKKVNSKWIKEFEKIVDLEKKCPYYNSPSLFFIFSTFKDSNSDYKIYIQHSNVYDVTKYNTDIQNFKAIFFVKKHLFACTGIFPEFIFSKKTHNYMKFIYYRDTSANNKLKDIDDSFSFYTFKYSKKTNEIKRLITHTCNGIP